MPILLVPVAYEGKRWLYPNAKVVAWPKLSEGLAALDSTAQADGMLVTDLLFGDNILVENGTGIILDFDLHRAWSRRLFAPALHLLGCTGCSPTQEGRLKQPHWCTKINFCDQVRLSPYLNLYGNAGTAHSIHAALRSDRPGHGSAGHGSGHGRAAPQVGRQHRTCKPCKPNIVRALNLLRNSRNESGCGCASVRSSSSRR